MPELDLLLVQRGTVTAPAGCGKTQLIADTLKLHASDKPALVLTHTNAGKGALEARLTKAAVPKGSYRVATIDSWAIRLISKFPVRSGHNPNILKLENPGNDYVAIRDAAWRLLSQDDITDVLRATYSRLIVDEYQDCTLPQHNIIGWAASVLPTCVLGDPLQAIFGFREATVDWQKDVHALFPAIGDLNTPWRWLNAGSEALGQWLLDARKSLLTGQTLDLRGAPPEVTWIPIAADPHIAHTQRMEAARTKAPTANGTVLVIGDSTSPQGQRQIASQTPGATTVEAVDLRDLTAFGRSFDPSGKDAFNVLMNFASEMMTNLGVAELHRRLGALSKGTARKEASVVEAVALGFLAAPSFSSALEVMRGLQDAPDVRIYRPEVLHVCLAAMQAAASGECSLYDAVVRARERNRHLGRPMTRRAVGSTLLLKGLEADVVVVLNPAPMNAKHLYVALTRGAKRVVVCSPSPILAPAG
ncbi:UvrD-helicase domain-containing protein [Pseudomonas sp. HY7a-MNA-CIBAN-0227]|uniref:UvrD-helicase domain-containing protein n=1 Tax=Pseudomonas sp. HY7a-MNA-CIBAN-0227 TaxID=3140474 RepID=UPI003331782E